MTRNFLGRLIRLVGCSYLAPLVGPTLPIAAQTEWSPWQPVVSGNCIVEFRTYQVDRTPNSKGSFQFNYQARSTCSYAVILEVVAPGRENPETLRVPALATERSWTFASAAPTARVKNTVAGKGGILDAQCIQVLRTQNAKIEAATGAKGLLAWTPLMMLAGESNAIHLAKAVADLPWGELADALGAVNKVLYNTLATEALIHANTHYEPEVAAFWRRLSDAYAERANR